MAIIQLQSLRHLWAYIALLNLRVRRTQSLFASFITCFRGGRHRAHRWFLLGHRRLVRGSQVAAWDVGTSWHGLCLCVGLLGHIFGSCCTRQLLCFRMMYCWVYDPLSCVICIFLIYELLYEYLCHRVCDVPVVPQVLISVLYIDSYASVYGTIDVLRGSGNFHALRLCSIACGLHNFSV